MHDPKCVATRSIGRSVERVKGMLHHLRALRPTLGLSWRRLVSQNAHLTLSGEQPLKQVVLAHVQALVALFFVHHAGAACPAAKSVRSARRLAVEVGGTPRNLRVLAAWP